MGCYGDGGMVFTDNEQLAVKMCWIRNHGQNKRYNHKLIGLNARLDTLQAAVVLAKFDQFVSKEIDLRRRVADKYIEKLQKKDIRGLVLPDIKPENESVWAQFSIRVKEKAGLLEALKNKGIPTAVHYPKPLHLQEAFSAEGYRPGSFPVAEKVSEEIMSLPMHPYLTDEEIALVAEEIDRFFKK